MFLHGGRKWRCIIQLHCVDGFSHREGIRIWWYFQPTVFVLGLWTGYEDTFLSKKSAPRSIMSSISPRGCFSSSVSFIYAKKAALLTVKLYVNLQMKQVCQDQPCFFCLHCLLYIWNSWRLEGEYFILEIRTSEFDRNTTLVTEICCVMIKKRLMKPGVSVASGEDEERVTEKQQADFFLIPHPQILFIFKLVVFSPDQHLSLFSGKSLDGTL